MFKPFALAPCGHVACYDCLVRWFSTDNDDEPAGPVQFRKKTCPHCRAVIRNAPVAVWGMKSIAIGIAKSGILPGFDVNVSTPETLGDSGEGTPKDLWADIFRPIPDIQARNGGLEGGEDVGFYDAEDGGVYRCLQCMHEIWEGTCTFCGRFYSGHEHDDVGHDVDEEEPLHEPQGHGGDFYDVQWLLNAVRNPARRIFGSIYREESNEEEEYDGSFIDDDDDRGWPLVPTRQSSENPESRLDSDHNFRESSPISEVSTEVDEGPTNVHTLQHNPPRRRQIGERPTPDRLRPRNTLGSSSEDMDSVASGLEPDQDVRRSNRITELRNLARRREPYSPSAYESDEDYIRMTPVSYPRDQFNDSDEDEQSTDEAEPNGVGGVGSDDDDESNQGFRRSTRLRTRRGLVHDDDSE
jgi:hypothetical protein